MTATDEAIRPVGNEPVTSQAELPPVSREFYTRLQGQITGLLEDWQRAAARYGELGAGHERHGNEASAWLMALGTVVYDRCARDLAGLLIGLDCQFFGERGRYTLEDFDPDREGPA